MNTPLDSHQRPQFTGRKLAVGILIGVMLVFTIAGVKVSRLVRTTTFQSNSLFIVVTGTTTKVTRHVQAHDLARGLGPWITNSGSGSGGAASNAIANTSGHGTNTTLYGTTQIGDANAAGSTTISNSLFARASVTTPTLTASSAATMGGTLEVQGLGSGRRAVFLDQNSIVKAVAEVDDTELGYLDGVTSGIQAQIDARPTNIYEGPVIHVRTNGDDSTYVLGRMDKPARTPGFAFAQAVNGATIRFGPGTYSIAPSNSPGSTTAHAPLRLLHKTNVVVEGDGPNTTIVGANAGNFIVISNCYNTVVRNMRFDGQWSGHTSNTMNGYHSTIWFIGNKYLKFQGLTFENINNSCLFSPAAATKNNFVDVYDCHARNLGCTNVAAVGSVADGAFFTASGDNIRLSRFSVDDAIRGIELFTSFSTNIIIESGMFNSNNVGLVCIGENNGMIVNNLNIQGGLSPGSLQQHGVILFDGVVDAILSDIRITGVTNFGMWITASSGVISNVTLNNVNISGSGAEGININDQAGGGAIDRLQIRNSIISGNATVAGIVVTGARNFVIENNEFFNNAAYCILMHGSADPTTNGIIRNNQMRNGTGVAIGSSGGVRDITLQNNRIEGMAVGDYDISAAFWEFKILTFPYQTTIPSGGFLRGTNIWFDGGVSLLYTNTFIANSGGVSNILATNIIDGQTVRLEIFPAVGVTVGFPQFTAAQWGGAVPTIETNLWNIIEVTRHGSITNLRHSIVGYELAMGANMTATTNHAARTISLASSGSGGSTNVETFASGYGTFGGITTTNQVAASNFVGRGTGLTNWGITANSGFPAGDWGGIWLGDSWQVGTGATTNTMGSFTNSHVSGWSYLAFTNYSVAGMKITTNYAGFSNSVLPWINRGTTNDIVHLIGGGNDMGAGSNAQQVITFVSNLCNTFFALGIERVVLHTHPPGLIDVAASAVDSLWSEIERYNMLLEQQFPNFATHLVKSHAVVPPPPNLKWWDVDGVHGKDYTYDRIALAEAQSIKAGPFNPNPHPTLDTSTLWPVTGHFTEGGFPISFKAAGASSGIAHEDTATGNKYWIGNGSGQMLFYYLGALKQFFTASALFFETNANFRASLSVTGDVRFIKGAGAGKVFTDATGSGLGTWETPSGGGGGGISALRTHVDLFDDFFHYIYPTSTDASTVGPLGFTKAVAGSGAAVASSTGETNSPGVVVLGTGTTTSGISILINQQDSVRFSLGSYTNEWRVRVDTLPNFTDSYIARVGFCDSGSGTDGVDGVFFRWSTNTANFVCVARSNSTESSVTNTTAVAATTWVKLRIVVNAAGTSAAFTVNDADSQTLTTNIPIGVGRQTGLLASITKDAGTTSAGFSVDYVYLGYDINR